MMRKFWRAVLKVIVFSSLFLFLLSSLSVVFTPRDPEYLGFFQQPKNSIDVLFLGSSSFHRGLSPLTMWQKFGFTSFNLSSSGQTPLLSYYFLRETLKTQRPRVLVLDPVWFSFDHSAMDTELYHWRVLATMDILPNSLLKWQLARDVVSKTKNHDFLSIVFPFLRYHSRWAEIDSEDLRAVLTPVSDHYRGFSPIYNSCNCAKPADYMAPVSEITPPSADALEYYNKIAALCQENGIELLLITLPRLDNWNYSYHRAVEEMAAENGWAYRDYSMPTLYQAAGFVAGDYLDPNHLNTYGAEKASTQLGAYLSETYHLNDRRQDPAFKQWTLDALKLADQLKKK